MYAPPSTLRSTWTDFTPVQPLNVSVMHERSTYAMTITAPAMSASPSSGEQGSRSGGVGVVDHDPGDVGEFLVADVDPDVDLRCRGGHPGERAGGGQARLDLWRQRRRRDASDGAVHIRDGTGGVGDHRVDAVDVTGQRVHADGGKHGGRAFDAERLLGRL